MRIMRKLIWGLTALIVAIAGVAYLAASYAARHPETINGQYASAAECLARRCNPVALVQRLLQPAREAGAVACRHSVVEVDLAPEARVVIEEPPTILIDTVEPLEPIEVAMPQPMVIQVEAEESDTAAASLERLAPEDVQHIPAHMPYAHEEVPPEVSLAETGWFHEESLEWAGQCGRRLRQCFGNMCSWPEWLEKMPGAEDVQQVVASESEEPYVHPCNAMETVAAEEISPEFVDLTTEEDCTADEPANEATMAGPGHPEGGEEQAVPGLIAPDPSAAPPCREDPNFHHHYPGCPFTGQPGTGNPCQPPVKLGHQPNLTDGEEQAPAGLDTMECRPTDLEDSNHTEEPF